MLACSGWEGRAIRTSNPVCHPLTFLTCATLASSRGQLAPFDSLCPGRPFAVFNVLMKKPSHSFLGG